MLNSVTPRTAGFNTVDISKLTEGSLALAIILMGKKNDVFRLTLK